MKTNHKRFFVDKGNSKFSQLMKCLNGVKAGKSEFSDSYVYPKYIGADHSNGNRGISRKLKGAKKFIKSRIRFKENSTLNKLIRNL